MENLLEIVEKFLAHSDDKLEELAEKNRQLKSQHQGGDEEVR